MLKQFWTYVQDKESGCREWTKAVGKYSGYGIFRGMNAHVFAYMDVNPDEDIWDMHIHHICENKKCVNPEHLVALTPGEHISLHKKGIVRGPDGPSEAKKAAAARYRERVRHCGEGHEFTDENTGYQLSEGYESRYCKECARIKSREHRAENYVAHPKPTPTHCPHGHEYTAKNAKRYTRPNGKTKLSCHECNKIRGKEKRRTQSLTSLTKEQSKPSSGS